jgi:hypothetical protein
MFVHTSFWGSSTPASVPPPTALDGHEVWTVSALSFEVLLSDIRDELCLVGG